MPQIGLLIFLTSPNIVSLGATRNSCYPGTGLPIGVKRTVCLPGYSKKLCRFGNSGIEPRSWLRRQKQQWIAELTNRGKMPHSILLVHYFGEPIPWKNGLKFDFVCLLPINTMGWRVYSSPYLMRNNALLRLNLRQGNPKLCAFLQCFLSCFCLLAYDST